MTGTGGGGGAAGQGGSGGGPAPDPFRCSDLFQQDGLVDYAVDIGADEWAKLTDEFLHPTVDPATNQWARPYHPVTFHYQGETVADAAIRLKGQSSWRHAINDPNPKMQLVVAFDQVNTNGKFHGVSKIVLDMPDSDRSFLNSRLAYAAFRDMGLPAPCGNSGRLSINGQYYGLYANLENENHGFLKRIFPEAPDGDLFKGGWTPQTNKLAPNWTRLQAFHDATDVASMEAIIDVDYSITEWAAEAMINAADGYYGGAHNFNIYDYPGKGYRWIIGDADSDFAWLWRSDYNPIYWWVGRGTMQKPGQHYLIVMNDATWRARYIEKLGGVLGRYDVAKLQGWIDAWAAQILPSVDQDQHKAPTTVDQYQQAVAATRQEVADRAAYVAKFLGCEAGSGDVTDADHDNVAWCNDCDDANATVHPGAPELCNADGTGNLIDDNCNGVVDEGCSIPPPPPADGGTPPPVGADAGAPPPPPAGGSPDAGAPAADGGAPAGP